MTARTASAGGRHPIGAQGAERLEHPAVTGLTTARGSGKPTIRLRPRWEVGYVDDAVQMQCGRLEGDSYRLHEAKSGLRKP